jgi:hypothetical protein
VTDNHPASQPDQGELATPSGDQPLLAPSAGPATTAATPPELEQVIRFALSELGARNGHHTFEDICRHIAERRIASNILPASGPVSAGGDQGRDIETYHSYLRDELGPHGAFLGLISEGLAVFTATLQEENLSTKIRTDVDKILSSGRTPASIYAFCVGRLSVGQRHALEDDVGKVFTGRFEVLGLDWLAAQLAHDDLFWVAERYLQLPAALAPPPPADEPALPDWYLTDRDRWRERGVAQRTLGDILDLKDGLRHATRFREARPDLPFWFRLARQCAGDDAPHSVRHRARYEIAWAAMQAMADIRAVDDPVRGFFDDLIQQPEVEPSSFADAGVLLTGLPVAVAAGRTEITPDEVRRWNDQLRERLRVELTKELRPTRRAEVLDSLAFLSVTLDPLAMGRFEQSEAHIDVLEMVDETGAMKPIAIDESRTPPSVDKAGAMQAWLELAELIPGAPLFPVGQLGSRLAFIAPLLIDEPGWRMLIDAIDQAVERSSGGAAVAARARDRGIALMRAERPRDAVHELHTAKVHWWGGDTLRGSLLAMLLISSCYRELRLPQAAKQYALAASYAASVASDDEVIDLLSSGLLVASETDYQAGATCSALELLEAGIALQSAQVEIDANSVAADLLERAYATLGFALMIARATTPAFVPFVERVAQSLGIRDSLEEELPAWTRNRDEVLKKVDEQLLGRFLSDGGARRVIRFAALGIDWTISSSNRFSDARAAERFAAAIQIALPEMADADLCVIPSKIDVEVENVEQELPADERLDWSPTNDGRRWRVRLSSFPPNEAFDPQRIELEVLTCLTPILIDASLLPPETFMAALETAFSRGLSHKLGSVRPYDELGLPAEIYNRTPRANVTPPADPHEYPTREHPQLAWRSDLGPTYDIASALEAIARRYERIPQLIPGLIQRLEADEAFLAAVAEMRTRGWLDWHILQALASAAMNDALLREGLATGGDADAARRRAAELIETGGFDEDPGHPLTLTVDDMEFARRSSIPLVIDIYGLRLNQPTPDFAAIDRFLGERYRYWTDDVDHPSYFSKAPRTQSAA